MKRYLPVRTAVRTLVVGAVLGFMGTPGLRAQATPAPDLEFRFSTGDALRIVVWGDISLSGDFEILTDGRLAHPLLQEIVVVGRPFSEVQADVIDFVGRFHRTPQVVITPLLRIGVGGHVVAPGVKAIDPRTSLVELIGAANGLRETARVGVLDLVRGGVRQRVELWSGEWATQNLLQLGFRSGDQVFVPKDKSAWRDYIYPALPPAGSLVSIVTLIRLS